MGRGRGKGKKQSGSAAGDNGGSGDDGKLTSRRRGRPQKLIKEDTKREDEAVNIEEEEEEEEYNDNSEDTTGLISSKISKNQMAADYGRKRKGDSQTKGSVESVVTDENSSGSKTNALTGNRQNGHRRKNKPRRAAEAVVEC